VADVSKDAKRIIDESIEYFGQLDVLVNNAGIFMTDTLEDINMSDYDRIMDTNLRSVVVLSNLAVPYLEKTKGNIVNVSSDAGIQPYGEYISYCISKAGMNQFTKCSAISLAKKGIRVNAINPGDVRTPIFESVGVTEENAGQFFEECAKQYLVGRVGEVSDTSAAIEYLASQPFINGILLPVDGGLTCTGPRRDV